MIKMRTLAIATALLLQSLPSWAQGVQPLQVQADQFTFSIDIPTDWKARSSSRHLADSKTLVELFPAGFESQDDQSPKRCGIRIAYYKDRVPLVAKLRWEKSMPPSLDSVNLDDLPTWDVTEGRGSHLNAYTAFGGGAIVVHRLICTSRNDEIRTVLLEVLRSFKEVRSQT